MPFKQGNTPWNKGTGNVTTCQYCGKEFKAPPSRKAKYCSHGCYAKDSRGKPGYWKGKKHTQQYKDKMSKLLSGKGNPRYGKAVSEETREKISRSVYDYNRKAGNGETSENRKLRSSKKFSIWRRHVFKKDNWTCQKCGKRGGRLHPHHIYNFADYADLRFEIDNGITLCKKCHRSFHKIYGKRNTTRVQLERFLKDQ